MGNPLGVHETNYKVKKSTKLIIWENMASFRLALSFVILLYLFRCIETLFNLDRFHVV